MSLEVGFRLLYLYRYPCIIVLLPFLPFLALLEALFSSSIATCNSDFEDTLQLVESVALCTLHRMVSGWVNKCWQP